MTDKKQNADTDAIKAKQEALMEAMQAAAQDLYAHAAPKDGGAQQQPASDASGGASEAPKSEGGKDDVIDADFEMVDDKKKR